MDRSVINMPFLCSDMHIQVKLLTMTMRNPNL